MMTSHIRNRERVRDLAEVYTNEREVHAMLNNIPWSDQTKSIAMKFLEPACGNGNFLIEVLRRKLEAVNHKYRDKTLSLYEFYIARAITTIYGIDICQENIEEARARLFQEVKLCFDLNKGSYLPSDGFLGFVHYVFETNIIRGDTINSPENIVIVDYKTNIRRFYRRYYLFHTLSSNKPSPFKTEMPEHYLVIGKKHEVQKGVNLHAGKQRYIKLV